MTTTCVTFLASLAWLILCTNTASGLGGFYDQSKADVHSLLTANVTDQVDGELAENYICVTHQASSADLGHLCHLEGCDTLHCVLISKNNVIMPAVGCFNKVCSNFSITLLTDTHARVSRYANIEVIETIINEQVVQNSYTEVKNILTLECADENSHLFGKQFKLEISNISKDFMRSEELAAEKVTTKDDSNASNLKPFSVHIIYFRFLSRWESYIKLPRSHAAINLLKQSSDWNVFSTKRYQSSSLLLEHNLRLLLGEFDKDASYENLTSLISLAIKNGRCFLFRSLGCHHPAVYSSIVNQANSPQNVENCAAHVSHFDVDLAINVTSCGKDNALFDNEGNTLMQNVLSQYFNNNRSSGPNIFSVSIVNVPDIRPSYNMDKELAIFLSSLTRHQSHSFILMSDVGDPKFARLDASTFLRRQTFNPFIFILTSRRLNITTTLTGIHSWRGNHNESSLHQLIGALDIFHLLEDWVESNKSIETERENDTTLEMEESADVNARQSIIIRGPVECICEKINIRFPNDSIQAAFASFSVGHLHNYLLDLSSGSRYLHCDRLTGIYFDNVHHVLSENSTDIAMTITIASVTRIKNAGRMFRINTHLQYTTDKFMQFTLSISLPGKKREFPLKSFEARKILNNFCRPISDVEHENLLSKSKNYSVMNYGHFGVEATVKPIHSSCLFLITTRFPDSTVLEVDNRCDDNSYHLTVSAELIDTISLVPLPATISVGSHKTRYISSLVKAYYGAPWAAYKLSFKVASDLETTLSE
ncbi:hypothetical protein Btru_005609 [Bulinus truncatus]|nr:hypothetical protein Btru_005609 [Bulinus truncatus]